MLPAYLTESPAKSGLQLASLYALVATLIFLLQVFPLIGFLLMVVGGPLWIGWLTHIALLHLTINIFRGYISRVWIFAPILFYGVGYVLHLVSVYIATSEAAAINMRNSFVEIDVRKPFSYLQAGNADSFSLMTHYVANRSYKYNGKEYTKLYYAEGAECEAANQSFYYDKRYKPWVFRWDVFGRSIHTYKGIRQCILSVDITSAIWEYEIKSKYTYNKDTDSWLYSRRGIEYEIIDSGSGSVLGKIETATYRTLSVFPQILAGCGLNGMVTSWV